MRPSKCTPRASELARPRWGGIVVSPNGVWRCLRRHGLNTRTRRLQLVAGYAARYERAPAQPEPERHVEASRPGELVGVDCFFIGRLSGTKGSVWQYTAIDVASGFVWAELHSTPLRATHSPGTRAGRAGRLRAGPGRVEAGGGDHRQRLRVPLARVR